MAEDQLSTLITYFEEEKIRLETLINECLTESEYLMAHYHSRALHRNDKMLYNLKNLNDKFYDEKSNKQNYINNLKKMMASESSEFMPAFFSQQIEQLQEELFLLNQASEQNRSDTNTVAFKETLKQLVDRKIKSFKLILNKSDNLYLEFRYNNKRLIVTLPYLKRLIKESKLGPKEINSIKNLGFEFASNDTKLVLMLTGDKNLLIEKIMAILVKIIFDTFYVKHFTNESYIEIIKRFPFPILHKTNICNHFPVFGIIFCSVLCFIKY
jgi:hypothetical protein